MSWIHPAPHRVGRIRRVCVEGVNQIDDLFEERHHHWLAQTGADNDTVEALRGERLLEPVK
jgi:hypothetical protein